MSDEEAEQVAAAIEQAMVERAAAGGQGALDEFIQQWRAEIEAGRPVDRKLKVEESPGFDELAGVPRARTSTTGEFVGKTDYRPKERLDLLLEALGLSLVSPAMMAVRFLDTVERYREGGQADGATIIQLAPTGEAGDPALRLDRARVDQATEAAAPVARLLEELSQETGLRERAVGRSEAKS